MSRNQPHWLIGITIVSLVLLPFKAAQGDDLRSAVQNPISSLISLPFKFTFDEGAPNGSADFLNIQPVVPVTVGDWNLVNRAIVPLIDLEGTVSGTQNIPNPTPGNGASGLGDINYSIYFSPVKTGKVFGVQDRHSTCLPPLTTSWVAGNGVADWLPLPRPNPNLAV